MEMVAKELLLDLGGSASNLPMYSGNDGFLKSVDLFKSVDL